MRCALLKRARSAFHCTAPPSICIVSVRTCLTSVLDCVAPVRDCLDYGDSCSFSRVHVRVSDHHRRCSAGECVDPVIRGVFRRRNGITAGPHYVATLFNRRALVRSGRAIVPNGSAAVVARRAPVPNAPVSVDDRVVKAHTCVCSISR